MSDETVEWWACPDCGFETEAKKKDLPPTCPACTNEIPEDGWEGPQ
jgi:predicted Zn-ribbon and HTH transcriptional regulator